MSFDESSVIIINLLDIVRQNYCCFSLNHLYNTRCLCSRVGNENAYFREYAVWQEVSALSLCKRQLWNDKNSFDH